MQRYEWNTTLDAEPADAMADSTVSIVATGMAGDEPATLIATMQSNDGAEWRSETPLPIDADDSMRWAWSMARARPPVAQPHDALAAPAPARVTLEVERSGRTVAKTSLVRRFVHADAIAERVSGHGLVGVLIRPEASGPLPGVIVLAGGGGGLNLPMAGMLASHGYAAFALAYFGLPGLPDDLVDIPLEYFERGIAWLAAHPAVDRTRLAVEGRSKGGELALLLGATFPALRAVVATVPSSITHGWMVGQPPNATYRPCWTHRGVPLPYTPVEPNRNRFTPGKPYSIRPGYESTLERPERVRATAIPVERTRGAILMISGTDDAMWPSTPFCELAMRRLEQHAFAHEATHLAYAGAGHDIGLPNLPTTPVPGTFFAMGGSPAVNAAASREAWRAILGFLDRSLATA